MGMQPERERVKRGNGNGFLLYFILFFFCCFLRSIEENRFRYKISCLCKRFSHELRLEGKRGHYNRKDIRWRRFYFVSSTHKRQFLLNIMWSRHLFKKKKNIRFAFVKKKRSVMSVIVVCNCCRSVWLYCKRIIGRCLMDGSVASRQP